MPPFFDGLNPLGIGELFALLSAVTWAFAVILLTRIGDRMPALEMNLIKNTIGGCLVLATALVFEFSEFPTLSNADWAVIIFSGFVGIAVADTLYLKALSYISASSMGVVGALYSPFVIIVSIVYLGEGLVLLQFLGLCLVLSGVMLISTDDKRLEAEQNRQHWRGIALGISAVFLTALCVVLVKPILEVQPFFWATTIRLWAGVAGLLIFILLTGRLGRTLRDLKRPHNWKAIVAASVLSAYVAMMFFLAGYKYTEASIAAILNETATVFIVLFAWLFLKEHISRKKLLGVGIAVVGVVLVLVG